MKNEPDTLFTQKAPSTINTSLGFLSITVPGSHPTTALWILRGLRRVVIVSGKDVLVCRFGGAEGDRQPWVVTIRSLVNSVKRN